MKATTITCAVLALTAAFSLGACTKRDEGPTPTTSPSSSAPTGPSTGPNPSTGSASAGTPSGGSTGSTSAMGGPGLPSGSMGSPSNDPSVAPVASGLGISVPGNRSQPHGGTGLGGGLGLTGTFPSGTVTQSAGATGTRQPQR